jgi:hypothetical protein
VSLDSKTTVAVDRGTVLDLNRLAIDLERAEGRRFTLGDVIRKLIETYQRVQAGAAR